VFILLINGMHPPMYVCVCLLIAFFIVIFCLRRVIDTSNVKAIGFKPSVVSLSKIEEVGNLYVDLHRGGFALNKNTTDSKFYSWIILELEQQQSFMLVANAVLVKSYKDAQLASLCCAVIISIIWASPYMFEIISNLYKCSRV
jgi:hypothetical protein